MALIVPMHRYKVNIIYLLTGHPVYHSSHGINQLISRDWGSRQTTVNKLDKNKLMAVPEVTDGLFLLSGLEFAVFCHHTYGFIRMVALHHASFVEMGTLFHSKLYILI